MINLHTRPPYIREHRHHYVKCESNPVNVHVWLHLVYQCREVHGYVPDREEREQEQHAAEDVEWDALANGRVESVTQPATQWSGQCIRELACEDHHAAVRQTPDFVQLEQ